MKGDLLKKSDRNEGKFDFWALVLDSVLGREVTSLASDGGGGECRCNTWDRGKSYRRTYINPVVGLGARIMNGMRN